jgi:hypothetical protein
MTEYVVCIPSYKRAQLCNDKTLTTLKEHHIPAKKIYVYVANKEEYDEYVQILDKTKYNKLIIGVKGIVPQRQFIKDYWPEGKHIVSFDDDVASIDLNMSSRFKGKSLDFFLKSAFKECKQRKAYIWGVYPVFNPYFRKARDEVSTCLNYIVAAFYGYINRPKLNAIKIILTKENGQKEDVEMSIKYFIHDGIVLRFNRIGFETKYYGKSGGLGNFDERMKPMLEASNRLKKAYPEYGEVSTKKTGMTEFRLKKIPARTEQQESNSKTKKLPKTHKNKSVKSK